jgi:hypothetical protein
MAIWHRAVASTAYLTIRQVYSWIRNRNPEILEHQHQYWWAIDDDIIQDLNDFIAGKVEAVSNSAEALLQLLAALETGRVKAIGRLNHPVPGWGPLSRPLPRHHWVGLTFVNRTPSDWSYVPDQTCAALKTHPQGRFWCDLLFERTTVLAVWPAISNREEPAGEETGGNTSRRHPGEDDRVKGNRKLRLAPSSAIHSTITEVYDEFENMNQKPPNLREIIAPVRDKLKARGYEASGRRIQTLANTEKHRNRRRKPGTTILSENKSRRRQ